LILGTDTLMLPLQSNSSSFCPPPHSGYQWDGSDRRFFEGWYFRVTLPEWNDSFAFMYSIEDPGGGSPYSGGAAQILGPGEQYFCRTFPDTSRFWAWRNQLGLGHWGAAICTGSPRYLAPEQFEQQVQQGYQVTATHHQGCLFDPGSGQQVRWQYQVIPIDGWGDRGRHAQSTAGWLSAFQIFEPGWQILMAHGLASGWIEWQGQRYCFQEAPTYAEKNWGGAFPQRWFWMQCNRFAEDSELTLTAVGGQRQVLGWQESVGMIGVHHHGVFYEFVPWNAQIGWRVADWGHWQIWAETDDAAIAITGLCSSFGKLVRVPTQTGLTFGCRDTSHGSLTLELTPKKAGHNSLQATSQLCALEVGGQVWKGFWQSPLS
jgi:tocopherol cyclase